jgi:hypothetical protein
MKKETDRFESNSKKKKTEQIIATCDQRKSKCAQDHELELKSLQNRIQARRQEHLRQYKLDLRKLQTCINTYLSCQFPFSFFFIDFLFFFFFSPPRLLDHMNKPFPIITRIKLIDTNRPSHLLTPWDLELLRPFLNPHSQIHAHDAIDFQERPPTALHVLDHTELHRHEHPHLVEHPHIP